MMAGYARFWTMDKLDGLAIMRESGADWPTIAAHFGVTPKAVEAQFYNNRSGMDRARILAMKSQARDLWLAGKNTAEIAAAVGVSQAEIHNSRCYLGA